MQVDRIGSSWHISQVMRVIEGIYLCFEIFLSTKLRYNTDNVLWILTLGSL